MSVLFSDVSFEFFDSGLALSLWTDLSNITQWPHLAWVYQEELEREEESANGNDN